MAAVLVLLFMGAPAAAPSAPGGPVGGGPIRWRRRRRRPEDETNEPNAPADVRARYIEKRRVVIPELGPGIGVGITELDIALILALLEDE